MLSSVRLSRKRDKTRNLLSTFYFAEDLNELEIYFKISK